MSYVACRLSAYCIASESISCLWNGIFIIPYGIFSANVYNIEMELPQLSWPTPLADTRTQLFVIIEYML